MAAGFIKEVFHPEWLANPVLVRKKGGKWRMCVDYTGLNKACPKVPYPLPRIDQIVDSTAGCETLSFLDAYEIHKLMAAGFIKEVFHPEWLANPVLVRKKGGKWRMCVDYTGLNKACPKVPYPLPRIDQIVDSTAGCETLSFLDAYSGYHQIRMKESDQLATSFITPFGMYYYVTMLFGLRNAGATYQRCMNHVFGEHIGQTVEAY